MTTLKYFFLIALLSVTSYSHASEFINTGEPVPEIPTDLEWFAGAKKSLADFKGKKAVLFYFMRPGCGSCDKFAPHLYRLVMKNKDNLEVIGISDYPSEKIKLYLEKRLGDYPIIRDQKREYINRFIGKIDKYPYIALIGRDGNLKWYGRGKFHQHVTQEIKRVLEEKPATPTLNAATKHALVIGVNKGCDMEEPLSSPNNDAIALESTLNKIGYKEVITLTDKTDSTTTNHESIIKSINSLIKNTEDKGAVLLYFSGDAIPEKTASGNIDLQLLLSDKKIKLSELAKLFTDSKKQIKPVFIIDANHQDSKQKKWEDIAKKVGKEIPQATIILSAARWDRSLLTTDKTRTNFNVFLCENLAKADKKSSSPLIIWRNIRDKMSDLSRKSGILQSPFICNPLNISLANKKDD